MNAGTNTDLFASLMNQVEIPCERPARNAEAVAAGQKNMPHCGGMNPARWVLWFTCPCPPPYVLYCDHCKNIVMSAHLLHCSTCGLQCPPGQMYRLVEPLNRSAA